MQSIAWKLKIQLMQDWTTKININLWLLHNIKFDILLNSSYEMDKVPACVQCDV